LTVTVIFIALLLITCITYRYVQRQRGHVEVENNNSVVTLEEAKDHSVDAISLAKAIEARASREKA